MSPTQSSTSRPFSSSSPAATTTTKPSLNSNSYSRSTTIGLGAAVGATVSIFIILCFFFIQYYLRRHQRHRPPPQPTYQQPFPKHSYTSSTSTSSTRSILFPSSSPATSFDTLRRQPSHRSTPSTNSFHEPPPVQPALPVTIALPPVAESPIVGAARPSLRTFPKLTTPLPIFTPNATPNTTTTDLNPTSLQDWTTFFTPTPPPIRHEIRLYRNKSMRISTLSAIVEAPAAPTATIAATLRARARTENDALEAGFGIEIGKGEGDVKGKRKGKGAETEEVC